MVGLGGHARTKLLPAIAANGQVLAGVVTRQPRETCPSGVEHFSDIASAIAELPREVCFVIASPPGAHFAQAAPVLRAGRDVIIEKPAFVTPADAREAGRLTQEHGTVLVEAFMHRHTALYARFLSEWSAGADALDIEFVIPAMPAGTFREGAEITASSLYDIGCYPLSLLADLGLPLENVNIAEVIAPGSLREQVGLVAASPIPITLRIGVAEAYANRVSVRQGSEWTAYAPFFYGRPGDRTIECAGATATLAEGNAFQTMLAVPRESWLDDQPQRLAGISSVTERLSGLGIDLQRWRASPG